MNLLNVMFLVASFVVFCCSIYLTIARCYSTGLVGTTGLGMIALVSFTYFAEYWLDASYWFPSVITQTLVIGVALFLTQHVTRVVTKNWGHHRRPQNRSKPQHSVRAIR